MHRIVLFTLLVVGVLADYQPEHYSYSPAVGYGGGRSFSLTGEGRITAVRVWEYARRGYIYGFQFRYGYIWSKVVGYRYGQPLEIKLFDNEVINQISGKYAHYLMSVVFHTNKSRSLYAGQPSGTSFNMYASHPDAELHFISGRYSGPITSIGAHWVVFYPSTNSTAGH